MDIREEIREEEGGEDAKPAKGSRKRKAEREAEMLEHDLEMAQREIDQRHKAMKAFIGQSGFDGSTPEADRKLQ